MSKHSLVWLLLLGLICAVFGVTFAPKTLAKETPQNLLLITSPPSQKAFKKTANGKPFFDTSVTLLEAMVLGVEIARLLKDKN